MLLTETQNVIVGFLSSSDLLTQHYCGWSMKTKREEERYFFKKCRMKILSGKLHISGNLLLKSSSLFNQLEDNSKNRTLLWVRQSTATNCPERLWSLLLWRYSRPIWTPTCVTYCRVPALASGWTWWSPKVPISTILRCCELGPTPDSSCFYQWPETLATFCRWRGLNLNI